MKTHVCALVILGVTLTSHAQGTIAFGNNQRLPVTIRFLDGAVRNAKAEDNLLIGAFYAPIGHPADALVLAPGLATIGPVDGVMINAPNIFPLPGTEPGQVVLLQVRVWDAALGPDGWREAGLNCNSQYYGTTRVSQMTLGLTEGPSAVIWQGWDGTHPGRFSPLVAYQCPEPSTLVLGALGVLLLFFRQRMRRG